MLGSTPGNVDTGAEVCLTNRKALSSSVVKVLKTQDCRVPLQSIKGDTCAVAERDHFLEVTDDDGNTRRDWFLEVGMTAQDLLFGETFIQGESLQFDGRTGTITSWDWQGRPFRFRMKGSGREHDKTVRKLGIQFPRIARLRKTVRLRDGWNYISQKELGVNLNQKTIITEDRGLAIRQKGLHIPNQTFKDEETPVNIFSLGDCDLDRDLLIGRVVPTTSLYGQSEGIPADILMEDIRNWFQEIVDEESVKIKRTNMVDEEEDPPVSTSEKPSGEMPEPEWKKLIGRDCTSDPQYREVPDDEWQKIRNDLKLDSNEVLQKEMSAEQRERAEDMLRRLAHVFDTRVTPIDPEVGQHEIPLKEGAKPVSSLQYHLRPEHKAAVRKFVSEMLQQGLIKPCSSPWNSPLLVTPKPDGSPRICFDARKLNAQTIKDQYPVSNATQCLRRLRGSSLFSTGDMLSGFWQIPLRVSDQIKTAFATEDGQFCFTVMPFGLANASNCFCRVMSDIVGALKHLFVVLYIDDFLVNYREEVDAQEGRDEFDVHIDQVEAMLQKLSIAGMSLKAKKVNLFQRRAAFLGHIVDKEGIHMDPKKIEAIMEAPLPRNKKGVRAWVGVVNYYRHFVKDLAKEMKPLYNLLKDTMPNRVTIKPGDKADRAIKKIKDYLTKTGAVLRHPDFEKDFEIQCDASIYGLGATLVQYEDAKAEDGTPILDKDGKPLRIERVIEYASRSLSPAESRYEARELETLALLFACRKWHGYLGRTFTAVVDHKNLLRLQEYVKHNKRLARWAVALSEYDIELKYRKGSEHIPPDFLSRIPMWSQPREGDPIIRLVSKQHLGKVDLEDAVAEEHRKGKGRRKVFLKIKEVMDITIETIRDAQDQDPAWKAIKDDLRRPEEKRQYHYTHLYKMGEGKYEGVLLFNGVVAKGEVEADPEIAKLNNRLVVPAQLRASILWIHHDHVMSGHQNYRAMYEGMARNYFWPAMQADIKLYCRSCSSCAKAKFTKNASRHDRLRSVINRVPFSVVFVDHVEIPAENQWGFTHILTAMCGFSKFLVAEPVQSTDSKTSAQVFFNRVVCCLGRIPDVVISDNGFMSAEWREFCVQIGARPSVTVPYNPKANQVERPHRFLKSLMRINAEAMNQSTWPQMIQIEVRAFNMIRGEDKLSPFEVLMGFQPDLPIEKILFPTPQSLLDMQRKEYHGYFMETLQKNHIRQRYDSLEKADKRVMDAIRDPKRHGPRFKVGDWVLVEQARYGIRKKKTATKLFYQCHGPHRIKAKRPGTDIYEIQIGDTNWTKEVPGVRLRFVPSEVHVRPKGVLAWAIDETNHMAACHSIGDMVVFKPPTNSAYAKLNVQIAEIVAIEAKGKHETVKVHLYSPDSDKGVNDMYAHKRPWYPLVKTGPNGYEMQKEKPKNLTRGVMQSRMIKELKVEDILPIPPLKMEAGNVISLEDQKRIRSTVNQGEPQNLEVTGKKRKYVDRNPRKYWYVRQVGVTDFAKTGVNKDDKKITIQRSPEGILRQALKDAYKHDPKRWIEQIQDWRLDEWRSRQTARRT